MKWIDTNTIITICNVAITFTQFFFWRHISRYKSYESEKGKNVATKEDIEEITQKIENVKSLLTIQTTLKVQLLNKQKEAIETCWSNYNIWRNSFLGSWINHARDNNIVWDIISKEEEAHRHFITSYQTISLYIDNKDFIKNIRSLHDKTNAHTNEFVQNLKRLITMNDSQSKGGSFEADRLDLLEKIRNIHKKMQEDIEIKEGIDQFKIYAKSYILCNSQDLF